MIPTHRPPTHPGEILLEEFLKAYDPPVTQADAAARMGIPAVRLNQVIRGHRGVTADTALRLAALTQTTPSFWLSLQAHWDLWHAQRARAKRREPRIRALAQARHVRDGAPRSASRIPPPIERYP